jgi:hypothetical protein
MIQEGKRAKDEKAESKRSQNLASYLVIILSLSLIFSLLCTEKKNQTAGYVSSAKSGDCNTEKGVKLVFYKDLDGDGYTDGTTQVGCSAPSGYVLSATSGDCNDNDLNINPGKTEICDGIDNNCNGQTDEGVKLVFYRDKDGDGYGDKNDQTLACAQPTGYVSNSSDCNDNDPNVSPGKNVIWTKTIGGGNLDYASSIIQSSDGGYVVAGYTRSFGAGSYDFYVVKLDSSGNVQWTKTIGGSGGDGAMSIIRSSDGGYVFAGSTTSFGVGNSDIYVVKMDANLNVCFSQNITNYSVSSNVGSFSSPSPVAISQSPTVYPISPTVSYGGSVSDVCPLAPAPHLCSASQDCGFGSAIAINKEDVKSYGCSAGGVLSRFLILVFMLIIIYGRFRKKKKKV